MNNEIKNRRIKEAIKLVAEKMHTPIELLTAYADGELSAEDASIVESHLSKCEECRDTLNYYKQEFAQGKTKSSSETKKKLLEKISPAINRKMELVDRINSKRDEIAEKISKKLLPEISWSMIPITIKNMRETSPETKYRSSGESAEMAIAAFSAGTTASQSKTYEVIEQVLQFTDIASNLLIERCSGIDDIEEIIPQCIDEAFEITGDFKIDDHTKKLILEIIRESLTGDEKG